jgi:hypothetical protein
VYATYQGRTLAAQEVVFHLPEGVSAEDSTRLTQQYIQSWVKAQALREAATKALPDLEARIRYQLRDYERSLVEHEYAQHLLRRQEEELAVSEAEVRSYYEKNQEKFRSKAPHYQYFYVETELSGQYKVVNMMRGKDEEQYRELIAWAEEKATEYKLDSSFVDESSIESIADGFYYGNIKKATLNTPYAYAHEEEGEKRYDFFKLIAVIDEGDLLPLEMCRARIEQLLRTKKKQKLIDRHFGELVNQARAAGKAKVVVDQGSTQDKSN